MKDEKDSPNSHRVSRKKLELLSHLLEEEGEEIQRIDAIAPREDRNEYPLSYAQERMWFLWRLAPDSSAYNVSGALRLRGRLDHEALTRALSEVSRRHEPLRTTFSEQEGRPRQIVSPASALALPLEDLSRARDPEGEALRLSEEEARRPFNLTAGPPLRAKLLRLAADDHVLTLAMHHIASDGWSVGVLLGELTRLYAAFVSGGESPLGELPVQYADYAAWQRERLASGEGERQLAYWRDRLTGVEPLELPTDRARPGVRAYSGSRVNIDLGPALNRRVREVAREAAATEFAVLLAPFEALLWRYTGQEQFAVGTPVAGRGRAELEGLVGLFFNTLALRADLSGRPTFRELVGRVRDELVGGLEHQEVPFERVVEELHPERDTARSPIFQVMFALHNAQQEEWRLPSLETRLLRTESKSAKFDLTLTALERAGEFSCELEYSAELFDEETAARMLSHYRQLLESGLADPSRPVSQLSPMTDSERAKLSEWNDTAAPYERDALIHQLFEAQAARTPAAVAAVCGDRQLTYAELDGRANRLARRLRALGVGPEVRVGLCVERSVEMLVGLFGILKAGGAYVPLDARHPRERLSFILDDARAQVFVTQAALADLLPAQDARVVRLDDDWPQISRESAEAPPPLGDAHNLAYVIYTSGSTGRPKGVMISHASVVNFLHSMCRRPGLSCEDTLLAVTTLSFDIAALELFGPLVGGGRVVIGGGEAAYDGALLAEQIEAARATLMQATPATWRLLSSAGWRNEGGIKILCGGEDMPPDLAAELLDRTDSLWNMYGPTETTIWSSVHRVESADRRVPIGRPIANTQLHILNEHQQQVPVGVLGELYLGGDGLARGYLSRPDLTAERFVPDPFSREPGARLYRTGDLARRLPDGNVEFLGRADNQVKVRGFRVELGEVEAALRSCAGVRDCAVAVAGEGANKRLVAYVVGEAGRVGEAGEAGASGEALRARLRESLPEYMIPSAFVPLDALPLTPNGKVDRKALPELAGGTAAGYVAPRTQVEEEVAAVWREVLGVERVGAEDNFFDLGGHSLLLAQAHSRLSGRFARSPSMLDMFKFPTVAALAQYLHEGTGGDDPVGEVDREFAARGAGRQTAEAVAIVGMSCRLPGARNVEEFWNNLRGGVESVTFFSDEELSRAGVDPAVLQHPDYVKACATLNDIELFDASFFGYSPREAEITDPQQRLFLECAWEALEGAGYAPEKYEGQIGVYAGAGFNGYLLNNLYPNRELLAGVGNFQAMIANDKDYISTRVSYEMNLTGPSMTVQTACSTSLVAVHLACQSLLNGECEMALAGGASVRVPQQAGYLYVEGGKNSPDGHCRAFDAEARGMVEGNGVGLVLLKRLSEALRDGDIIHAVIKGTAVNNDGSRKVGFTAPGADGQAKVIRAAHLAAGVEAGTVGYVEAHGTGTALGDPIEVEALTRAFRASTPRRNFCALGSLKTNIGHADAAAGVAGLIKAALSVRDGVLAPTLHFREANPALKLEDSPFYVSAELAEWQGPEPRRAGVSSFGIGGTNAHVVVEQAPERGGAGGPGRRWHVLPVSAKSEAALGQATANLAAHLDKRRDVPLSDVAYTLQLGRQSFGHRRMVVCRDTEDAAAALATAEAGRVLTYSHEGGAPGVVFMFPGGGAQHLNMARELYEREAVFREELDRCAELLRPELGLDLRTAIYPDAAAGAGGGESGAPLERPSLALTALFAVEYALARLWEGWGVRPEAMIGHSVGEYVAACLAGVFTLGDALSLVLLRGRLFERVPRGAMLSVNLGEDELLPLLMDGVSLAAVNGPRLCVASGAEEAVAALAARLGARGVETRRLHIDVAAHSEMLDGILDEFGQSVGRLGRRPPRIPFVSNVTGHWITAEEATSSAYWVRHLRETVRFAEGLGELTREGRRVLLEVGPGQTLSTLAKQQQRGPGRLVVASLRHPQQPESDEFTMLSALGRLWLSGVEPDWAGTYAAGERRRRVELPTYPFERRRYWIDAKGPAFVGLPGRVEAAEGAPAAAAELAAATPPAHTRPALLTPYVAPGTELERELAALWEEFLGVEGIGIHDNFFDLGGHSLLATRLLSRVREQYKVEVSLRNLFEDPTVNGLANAVREARAEQPGAAALAIERGQAESSGEPPINVDELSGEEVRLLLGRMLGGDEVNR